MKEYIQEIKKMDIGKVVENVSLSEHTSYKVGGLASCFVYPSSTKDLIKLLKYIKKNKIKYKVLGNGSNTLFSDNAYEGIIIKLDKFRHNVHQNMNRNQQNIIYNCKNELITFKDESVKDNNKNFSFTFCFIFCSTSSSDKEP